MATDPHGAQPAQTGRPRFSVLIPSYNRPEFVRPAADSVLASAEADFELIVSDDKSPRQAEIRSALAPLGTDPRFRFVAQERNLREPANRAFLRDAARGEWLVFLGDDDLLDARALTVLRRAIEANPGVDLIAFGYRQIDEHGRVQFERRVPRSLRIHRDADRTLLAEFLYSDAFPHWFYHPATFCVRHRVGDRIKPNNAIGIGDDLLFLFDYVNDGGVILVLPDVLMSYRRMAPSAAVAQGNQSLGALANVETRYRIMRALEARPDLCPQVAAIVRSAEYRRRFVYQSVASESLTPSEVAAAVGMRPDHTAELGEYFGHTSTRAVRAASYVRRLSFFVRIFGMPGLLQIGRHGFRRAAARIRRAPAAAGASR